MNDLTLDRKHNEVKLIINTKLYGYGAVMKAGKDYSDHCWVYVDGDINDKLLVTIKPKKTEINIDTLGNEFLNYVLGLMQNAIF
jgi:hypothetical protein